MRKFTNDFPKYVSEVMKKRLEELGMSRYRMINDAPSVNRPTLSRMLRGEGSTNISTLAHYCEQLGLEIIIKPKEYKHETDN